MRCDVDHQDMDDLILGRERWQRCGGLEGKVLLLGYVGQISSVTQGMFIC